MSTMELTDAEAFGSSQTVFQALKGAALAMLVVWTVIANSLVFIVLYKNPRLQTVPNLLASYSCERYAMRYQLINTIVVL